MPKPSDPAVPDLSTTERLLALWDALGLRSAHVAAPMPADITGLAGDHPERLAGIVLCAPSRLDPAPFTGVAERLLMIAGEHGLTAEATGRAAPRLPGAVRRVIPGYDPPGWADVAADHTDAIATWMIDHLDGRETEVDPPRAGEREGIVAGISYRIEGTGPALLLLPFFLAPSQWEPLVPRLAKRFSVIILGGAHIGGVAALEDRARAPTYRAMFRTLIDLIDPQPRETILDVGCGAGSLDRLLARRLGPGNAITAMDTNPFLLREAKALAAAEGLEDRIHFTDGNAEALPFGDASFDAVFSVTVLEECDADRALREMVRVARPGGRVGVVVRSIDMQQWWNLAVPESARTRAETPPRSVSPKGVADASLYPRMQRAGLADLVCFPTLVTLDNPAGPIWRHREDHVLSLLSPEETRAWAAAREPVSAAGLLFMSHPLHCAVGTRPR